VLVTDLSGFRSAHLTVPCSDLRHPSFAPTVKEDSPGVDSHAAAVAQPQY